MDVAERERAAAPCIHARERPAKRPRSCRHRDARRFPGGSQFVRCRPNTGVFPVVRIVKYPHPTLRHKSKPLVRVDCELADIVHGMFDLMYQSRGIGLAANQVDLPYRLFILNLESNPEQKEAEYVFINPVILEAKGWWKGRRAV